MFPESLGGAQDEKYSEQAIVFPQKNIPMEWMHAIEAGAIRLQTIDGKYCRLWKPYHFLVKWMKGRVTIFEFSDLDQLRSEIVCGIIASDKRKGYCFQRAGIFGISEVIDIFNKLLWN